MIQLNTEIIRMATFIWSNNVIQVIRLFSRTVQWKLRRKCYSWVFHTICDLLLNFVSYLDLHYLSEIRLEPYITILGKVGEILLKTRNITYQRSRDPCRRCPHQCGSWQGRAPRPCWRSRRDTPLSDRGERRQASFPRGRTCEPTPAKPKSLF